MVALAKATKVLEKVAELGVGRYTEVQEMAELAATAGYNLKLVDSDQKVAVKMVGRDMIVRAGQFGGDKVGVAKKLCAEILKNDLVEDNTGFWAELMAVMLLVPADTYSKMEKADDIETLTIKIARKANVKYKYVMAYYNIIKTLKELEVGGVDKVVK